MLSRARNIERKVREDKREKVSILEEIICARTSTGRKTEEPTRENSSTMVGMCEKTKHPTLQGRVLVHWEDRSGNKLEKWLPTLQGVTVRERDRVLLVCPGNWLEPVVVGVIDGFALRPARERLEKAALELERDESISVYAANGEKIIEIFNEDSGPVVKLLKEDVEVEMPGNLKISAKSVKIEAKTGDVKIRASEDVKVEGEVIHLN